MDRQSHRKLANAARTILERLEARQLLASTLPADLAAPVGTMVNSNDEHGLTVAYFPAKQVVQQTGGYLTAPTKGDALTIGRNYLAAHAKELGASRADFEQAIITNQHKDDRTGVTHIYLRQSLNGLPVVGAEAAVHVASDGRVISANSSFVRDLSTKAGQPAALSASQGLRRAAKAIDLPFDATINAARSAGTTTFTSPVLSQDPIPATMKYFTTPQGAQLGWDFVVRPPNHNDDWYNIAVSAADGSVVFASNWTDHVAQYNVFPAPLESPNEGGRQIVADPSNALASPFGWHDTNGVAGAEVTVTQGNNVSAQDDTDANNSGGTRPDGGAALNFDFPLNLANAPSTYLPASITNLFYWNNVIHDLYYQYGFTEAAGNFQLNNYGRGGLGNDRVNADAQDGAGTNNANFGTPPDGSSPRMQMFNWNQTSPGRDGDLDATIIIHEYGHGVSTRLTGGPANVSSLDAVQSGGMGEGWGDFWAALFTLKPTDNVVTGTYGLANYVVGEPDTGVGLRRFPYSFNMAASPLTIDAFGTSGSSGGVTRSTEVHDTGEIWATALWDLASLLITKHGFDADLYTGYTGVAGPGSAGNKLALQLVSDALKLQPANPSFSEARDAILQADVVLTGGQNSAEIWQAFARRGMGIGFNDGGSSASTSVVASFATPSVDPTVIAQVSPTNPTLVSPITSAAVRFSEPIDPASVSVSDFTLIGPGGVDLSGTISGFSATESNTLLTVNFAATTANGSYTLTIGPSILSVDDGHAMDQDLDGTPGEAADVYTVGFAVVTRIADGTFGYEAGEWEYQDVFLIAGQAGVTSILTSTDDTNALIPLGTNTFRFYSTTYTSGTSNAISVTDNGFVSFGVVSTAYENTDLTSPSAPRFAALWDDWYTQVDTLDRVLYRFDDINADGVHDRLVIQWNEVHSTAGGTGVTFQAILQLNTGAVPGTMIANYIDLDSSNVGVANGGSATVGIKADGAPPPHKLLVSMNDDSFPWVQTGKALRIATDWSAPSVSATDFLYESGPQKLTYQFTQSVAASLKASSLSLVNTTTGVPVPLANVAMSYDAGTNTATFTFPGYANGALPDGNYSASLAGVTDAAWNPLAGSSAASFFVLAGDANHDRIVDIADLAILATNWQQSPRTFSQGNFNYADNIVDIADLAILATSWQQSLALPGAASFAKAAVKKTGDRLAEQVFG